MNELKPRQFLPSQRRSATRQPQVNDLTVNKQQTEPMKKERPVIICTEFRGVFFGYATDTTKDTIQLKRARMAIYWGTTRGVMELAEVGPNSKSKISARADIEARKVTAVFEVTESAAKAWEEI